MHHFCASGCRNLLLTILLLAGGHCLAQSGTFGNFSYTSDGSEVTITSCSGALTSLNIPGEINGLPVTTISGLGSHLGPLRGTVTTVTIPSSVKTIGPSVFQRFRAIQNLTIPDSVTSIGNRAFWECTGLQSVVMSSGVTILDQTFEGCTSLTSVTLPDGVTTLTSTFDGCTLLSSIVLPESVTAIEGTFRNCTSLNVINFPANLAAIGDDAFHGCTGLTDLAFPSGLNRIGNGAFRGCSGLTSVELPEGFSTIGDHAFAGCTGLQSISLPASLTSIGDSAFLGCPILTDLVLPGSLMSIGAGAFQECFAITSVVVPDSVKTIGDNAFWNCPNLTDIHLPDRFLASLSSIGLDFKPQLATDMLIEGIANHLASNPAFISKLADEIISKDGHYGLSTQADLTDLAGEVPQTVRTVLAQVEAEQPPPDAITSDLSPLSVKRGKKVNYEIATNFGATAFSAVGLPGGLKIDPTTGAISGKATPPGTYSVFLHAGVPGGSMASAVKVIVVTR